MERHIKRAKKIKSDSKQLLHIENVTKYYSDDTPAIDNINLTINQGDLFALLGPSGCGKSTLLRMIAGFEKPTSGRIILGDDDITDLTPYKRPINMMFQSYALFPHMTVEENVAFGLKQEKLSKTQIDERVYEALEMVDMVRFAKRKPHQLSGGQMQRTALVRSLVKQPRILLLDEPLGALDPKTREQTQLELIKIQSLLDITFIIVTHDQEEAMAMADCMAVMKDGKILQVGTPQEIYEYPNSRFVAEFVDSINLFEGKVCKKRNDKKYVEIQIPETNKIIMAYSESAELGETVWLGLRPEELDIDTEPAPKTENQVVGKIIDIGFLGQKIIYHVELKNKKFVHVTIPTSERSKNPGFVLGKTVYLSWYHSEGVILKE
jgi:putrescine transport system ATP-binding protein